MMYSVRVIPKSSRIRVEADGISLKVHLTRPARDGLANEQLVDVLAQHFGVRKYQVVIRKGEASRNKQVEINE